MVEVAADVLAAMAAAVMGVVATVLAGCVCVCISLFYFAPAPVGGGLLRGSGPVFAVGLFFLSLLSSKGPLG